VLETLSAFHMAWTLLNQMNFGKNMFNLGFFNLIYRKSTL
jgi:ABC-type glucose/galactose transport system permease subunit